MKRNEVMCVFYNKTVNDHKTYQKFMDMLDDNKRMLKPLYYEDDDGKVLIFFMKRRLKKLQDIICDIKVSEILKQVLNGKQHYCSKCGCGYMTYHKYTYRDNCGCLSKSYECEVCQGYSDKAVRQIRDYARKYGTKKTLLKVLNDKFFKPEKFNRDKECDEDLPF